MRDGGDCAQHERPMRGPSSVSQQTEEELVGVPLPNIQVGQACMHPEVAETSGPEWDWLNHLV